MDQRSAMPGKSEVLTVSTTTKQFTAAKYQVAPESAIGAVIAYVNIEDADIRFTLDGTTPNPATKTGIVWYAGTPLSIEGQANIKNFKAVRNAGVDASIYVTYF
jgi:hypothetical protein